MKFSITFLLSPAYIHALLLPLKVERSSFPSFDSDLSGCVYTVKTPQLVTPREYICPFQHPELDSVAFDFNFTWKNAFCPPPEVYLDTTRLGLKDLVFISQGHILVLRIPSTPGCSYTLNFVDLTLFLPTLVMGNQCRVENEINFDIARSKRLRMERHHMPKGIIGMNPIIAVHLFVVEDYKSLWENLKTNAEKELYKKSYKDIRRAYLILQRFTTYDLKQRIVVETAVQAACEYLYPSVPGINFDCLTITVSGFLNRWNRYGPKRSVQPTLLDINLPMSLKGVSITDGVHRFVVKDYTSIWNALSNSNRKRHRDIYHRLRFAYWKLERFKIPGGDLTQRSVVEATTKAVCEHVNSFIQDETKHLDFQRATVAELRGKWTRYVIGKAETSCNP